MDKKMKLHPKPFFTKRRKVDAKYLKTFIKFVLFNSLFHKHGVKWKLSQNNLQKKLIHKPRGSTDIADKYLACQFFLR